VCDLAVELEARGRAPRVLDVGGGLPVRYREGDPAPTFAEYAAALRTRAPRVFSGPWKVVTEMGRAVFAPCAFALSRVEYVRPGNVAVLHVGADMFVRAAYRPESWWHDVRVLDGAGREKDGARAPWSLAGPLCFSGDFIAKERELPPIEAGDLVLVLDAGAYTLAMWSRYNSRAMPAVHGFADAGGLRLLKRRETAEDVARSWE
jgi:diaminopimelate decarboxylase